MNSSLFTLQQVAVIGAGTMGRGIVMSLANTGIPVLWLDNNPHMLEQALAAIAETWAKSVSQGRIDSQQPVAAVQIGELQAEAGVQHGRHSARPAHHRVTNAQGAPASP